jgi:5S rRNA maturation endonuclease (ribonuclease M5)
VVVCEGEPDAVTWMIRTSLPVIGITSGSWTQALADRIAFGSQVVVRTHLDTAGEKYADAITKSLKGRAEVLRRVSE